MQPRPQPIAIVKMLLNGVPKEIKEQKKLNVKVLHSAITKLYQLKKDGQLTDEELISEMNKVYENVVNAANLGIAEAKELLELTAARQQTGIFKGNELQQDLVTAFLIVPDIRDRCIKDCTKLNLPVPSGAFPPDAKYDDALYDEAVLVFKTENANILARTTVLAKFKFLTERQYPLARLNYVFSVLYDKVSPSDPVEAYKWLQEGAAYSTDARVALLFAYMILKEIGQEPRVDLWVVQTASALLKNEKNKEEFREKYLNPAVMYEIAKISYELPDELTKPLFEEAARRGNDAAKFEVALHSIAGYRGFSRNEKRACELFQEIIKKDSPQSLFVHSFRLTGVTLRNQFQNLVKNNQKFATELSKALFSQHDSKEQKSSSLSNHPDTFAMAMEYFLKPSARDVAVIESLFEADRNKMPFLYLIDCIKALEIDPMAAFRSLEKAAFSGNIHAQYMLAALVLLSRDPAQKELLATTHPLRNQYVDTFLKNHDVTAQLATHYRSDLCRDLAVEILARDRQRKGEIDAACLTDGMLNGLSLLSVKEDRSQEDDGLEGSVLDQMIDLNLHLDLICSLLQGKYLKADGKTICSIFMAANHLQLPFVKEILTYIHNEMYGNQPQNFANPKYLIIAKRMREVPEVAQKFRLQPGEETCQAIYAEYRDNPQMVHLKLSKEKHLKKSYRVCYRVLGMLCQNPSKKTFDELDELAKAGNKLAIWVLCSLIAKLHEKIVRFDTDLFLQDYMRILRGSELYAKVYDIVSERYSDNASLDYIRRHGFEFVSAALLPQERIDMVEYDSVLLQHRPGQSEFRLAMEEKDSVQKEKLLLASMKKEFAEAKFQFAFLLAQQGQVVRAFYLIVEAGKDKVAAAQEFIRDLRTPVSDSADSKAGPKSTLEQSYKALFRGNETVEGLLAKYPDWKQLKKLNAKHYGSQLDQKENEFKQSTDRMLPLKRMFDVVYGTEKIPERHLELLKENKHFASASFSKECWELAHKAMTGGKAKVFVRQLRELGLSHVLFPEAKEIDLNYIEHRADEFDKEKAAQQNGEAKPADPLSIFAVCVAYRVDRWTALNDERFQFSEKQGLSSWMPKKPTKKFSWADDFDEDSPVESDRFFHLICKEKSKKEALFPVGAAKFTVVTSSQSRQPADAAVETRKWTALPH